MSSLKGGICLCVDVCAQRHRWGEGVSPVTSHYGRIVQLGRRLPSLSVALASSAQQSSSLFVSKLQKSVLMFGFREIMAGMFLIEWVGLRSQGKLLS